MGIKPKFNLDKIFTDIRERVDNETTTTTIETLTYIGHKAVEHARSIPPPKNGGNGFEDQTGCLRSSIGFCIFKDGELIEDYFKGNAQGANTGKAVANNAAQRHPKGYILVVVAGMNYALYVESKGRDVLTSAVAVARNLATQLL